MWDSRTIHCNTPPTAESTLEEERLHRLVAYICMTPTKMVTDPSVIKQRVKAFVDGITTSHWPHEYIPMSDSFFNPEFELNAFQIELLTGDKEWH